MDINIIHTIDSFAIFVGLVGVCIILTGVVHGLFNFISLELRVSRSISHDTIRYQL